MQASLDRGIPEPVRRSLERLVEGLKGADPNAVVYLCGSFARGDWLTDSDVDIVVVTKLFAKMDVGKRFSLVKRLAGPGSSIDLLAYTPEEFKEAVQRSMILRDMLDHSLKLTS